MQEIADTFRAAGLPGDFHQAAREIYERMAPFKDASVPADVEAVMDAILGRSKS